MNSKYVLTALYGMQQGDMKGRKTMIDIRNKIKMLHLSISIYYKYTDTTTMVKG